MASGREQEDARPAARRPKRAGLRPREHRIIPKGLARKEASTPTCEMHRKKGRRVGKKEGSRFKNEVENLG